MIKVLIFCSFFLFNFVIAYFSQVIPYGGIFSFPDELTKYGLPKILMAFANFDGIHYLRIARIGYSQFQQAFFPLYPLSINLVGRLFNNNFFVAGILISNLAFLAGLVFLSKILNRASFVWTIVFLLTFPTSFFFNSLYSESSFFLLAVSCLYFLKKQNYWLVLILAFLASLTRVVGIFLIIPILISQISKFRSYNFSLKLKTILMIVAPVLGLLTYCFYLFKTTGDSLAFFHSHQAFGAGRSTRLILLPQVYFRYFKILITTKISLQYFISLFEVTTFTIVFIVLILDLIKIKKMRNINNRINRLGLNLFSLANLLLPTLTGTFLSIPRIGLLSLSFFLYLAEMKNQPLKIFITIVFLTLHIVFLSLFIRGYFVS